MKNNSRRSRGLRKPKLRRTSHNLQSGVIIPVNSPVVWRSRITPPLITVRLPYIESLVHTPGTFFEDYQFNLNSIFDPNRTGTGHQPLGHDQWATLYNRYRVMRVFIRTSVVNTSSSVPVRVTMAATNSATALGVTNSEEQPYSVSGISGLSTGTSLTEFGCVVDLAKLNGKTHEQFRGSDSTQAAFGSSPNEIQILHLFLTSIDGSNITAQSNTRFVFEVELSDPLELSVS